MPAQPQRAKWPTDRLADGGGWEGDWLCLDGSPKDSCCHYLQAGDWDLARGQQAGGWEETGTREEELIVDDDKLNIFT